jgi:predicted TIM-barrel fold metal-dependent hydrolase
MIDLSDVPVVDSHVHPWGLSTRRLTVAELAGQVAFSDTALTSVRQPFLRAAELEPVLDQLRATNLGTSYLRRELARLLNVENDWAAVLTARNAAAETDYRAWTKRLFDGANIATLLVDEGGAQPRLTLDDLGMYVPGTLRRVARSDNFVRDLLGEEDDWPSFVDRYQAALDEALADGAVAFKSVIAYRTGLDVEPVTEADARRNFESRRHDPEHTQKPLRDFLLCHTLDVARERGIWTHIHAAVGDPDIVYQRANPALLYPLLHSERFRRNRVVLIHGGWPWVGEAAAMAAILPNVYVDVSEGTLFGMPNVRQRMYETLEACSYAKVVYGADGSHPEALWIAARRYKVVLGRVLDELVSDGFCAPAEAHLIGRMILHDNAVRMYNL